MKGYLVSLGLETEPQRRWPSYVTDKERQLLERLAAEGKVTRLYAEDLQIANSLEIEKLLFLVPDTSGRDAAYAIITPKGRRILAGLEAPKSGKKPLGFLD